MPTTSPPEQEQPAAQSTAQPTQTAQPAASSSSAAAAPSSEQELGSTQTRSRPISNLQKERLRMVKAETAIFTRPGGG
eukprot:4964808-Pyramimonas_sp.AAC.1